MKRKIWGMLGLLLAASAIGCAANAPSTPEEVGTSHEALYYSHIWNVYSIENGVRYDRYPPDDVAMLTGLGFPLDMWDSGSSPSDNAGTICAWLPASGAQEAFWQCIHSDDFSAPNYISTPGGDSEYSKDVHVTKPINSGNWTAQWGTGGPGYSYSYYATYGT